MKHHREMAQRPEGTYMEYNNDFFQPQQAEPRKKGVGCGTIVLTAFVAFALGVLVTCLVFYPTVRRLENLLAKGNSWGYYSPEPEETEQPEQEQPQQSQEESAQSQLPQINRELPELGGSRTAQLNQDTLVEDIAEYVGPSVVGISITSVDSLIGWDNQSGDYEQQIGSASGVIISSQGHIITNYHVIQGAQYIYVTLSNGEQKPAQILGTDAINDLAVIKIDGEGYPAADFGDSSGLRVGERAIAIGNPLGTLEGTVTQGIVSAVDREISVEGVSRKMIQTDAAINPGNSGGALVNSKGEIIGICVLKTVIAGYNSSGMPIYAEGLGYAIPINDAIDIAKELIQHGYIPRPAIGITAQQIDDDLARYYACPKGFMVVSVTEDGAAEKAGIEPGDVIVSFDGQQANENLEDFIAYIKSKALGDSLQVEIWREGKTQSITVEISDQNVMNGNQ